MVDVPGDAPGPAVRVRVVVHVGLGVQDGTEKLGVTPVGTPLMAKLTACGKPATNVAPTVVAADAPIAMTASGADSAYLNGSTTVTMTVVVALSVIARGRGPGMGGGEKSACTVTENEPSGVDAEVAIIRLT